jgi:thiol-disulfide isomerase/thioredoxin
VNVRILLPSRGWAIPVFWGLVSLAGPGDVARGQAEPSSRATAERILHKVADFYKHARSASVETESVQSAGGQRFEMTATTSFQRPNRFAHRSKERGVMEVVSDGKTLYQLLPPLKAYTETPAPASLGALLKEGMVPAALQANVLSDLYSDSPYESLMEGVKTAAYAGQEVLQGVKADHLTFTQDQFDWELWVAADGDPLVLRVVTDLSKSMARSPQAAQFKGKKVELMHTYKGWKINSDLDEKTFAFQPPEGAKKFKSFQDAIMQATGGARNPDAPSPLVGKPAPAVSLKLLEGGEFQLKDHHGKDVVMIDFWATWCGPCVMELPLLTEVAADYKDKGVAFFAINLQEKPEQIRKFLKDKKLAMTVPLDSAGSVGMAYHADAIPMLVLIDKKGVVRSVHVGYNPAIKETLHGELDALLAGKDLPKPGAGATQASEAPKPHGLEPAWTASGPYSSVATSRTGPSIYALQGRGQCDVLDLAGKVVRTFPCKGQEQAQSTARVARLAKDSEGLLVFHTWGNAVTAFKNDGTRLWEEPGGQGIDDVCAADLDGDGLDEVIVGYNGSTGLHVFAHDGKRLWKVTTLGNVWHVAAGDLDGDGKPDVVSTSAQGKVHVFSAADGKPRSTLDAGLYANMVRTAPGRLFPSARGDVAIVFASGQSGSAMVAVGGDGKVHWTLKFPAGLQHCDSMAISGDGTWAALGLRGGRVCVVELAGGRIVAETSGQGMTPSVAWTAPASGAAPLLLVATGTEINAFHVKPQAAPESKQP